MKHNSDEVRSFMIEFESLQIKVGVDNVKRNAAEFEFLQCCSRDMCERYNWDHKYFQRMMNRQHQIGHQIILTRKKLSDNAEFVGAIIINMPQLGSPSDNDESMPGLQD